MGTRIGAIKTAASRIGLTYEEYEAHRAQGEKWCCACQQWHRRSAFPRSRHASDGFRATCLASQHGQPRRGREPVRERACLRVKTEVRAGRLARPNDLPCADCGHVWTVGERRHEYDHYLGYAPEHHLDVEAVCTTCHADREIRRRQRVTLLHPAEAA